MQSLMAQHGDFGSQLDLSESDSRSETDSLSSFFRRFTFEILDADAVVKVKKR